MPIDDHLKGKKPVAFVRLAPGAKIDEAGLKSYALENCAAYQHPRSIWFIDEFPLASTNKIDRALLTQRAKQMSNTGKELAR